MKIELIILGFFLILISIIFKKLRGLNSGGEWIFEDEKKNKIIMYIIRFLLFILGIVLFIYALFFQK